MIFYGISIVMLVGLGFLILPYLELCEMINDYDFIKTEDMP